MFTFIPFAIASGMALIDTVVFSWLKKYTLGTLSWIYIPIGAIMYGIQPLIFLHALRYETMTVMNIMWDMLSDVSVTAMGLFYFKEKLSSIKMIGLAFAFIAIVLLSYDEFDNK
jgi:multidrug transporter EmrE-like cation transporter